mgnify:CR=1 FL=1
MDEFRNKFHYPRKEKDDSGKIISIETPLTVFRMLNVGAVTVDG